jgi:TolB-like protein
MNIIAELKCRKVFKVGAAYLLIAWLAVQAASIGFPAFDAPAWALRIFILVSLLGFPVAVVLAWVFESTPGGTVVDGPVRGGKFVFAAAALLAILAVGWYFYGQASFHKGDAATPAAAVRAIPAKSIAVLPFSDLSPNHDQEYFSDGMAEEILDALAKVEDLKVAGRTSSFSFKGRNEDLRSIGATLGVANVLEGSVRKQGDKVRITAQLIRTDDDFHVWSESYDGDLSDVFALQERIAQAITGALQAALSRDQKAHLVQAGTANTDAYALYLQATDALNRRDYKLMGEAIGWLEKAIALDPSFARAHARLAIIHLLGRPEYGASDAAAETHAHAALALDPTLAEAQTVLAGLAFKQRRYVDSRVAMDRALELAPGDAAVHLYAGQRLINTGYTRQGIAHLDRALAIDPLLPNALYWRGRQYLFAGQLDVADRLFMQARDLGLSFADAGLSSTARARGETAKANDILISVLVRFGNAACLANAEASLRAMLDAEIATEKGRRQAHAVMDECLGRHPKEIPIWVPLRLLTIGEPQRALDLIAAAPTQDEGGLFMDFWSPHAADARRLPTFAAFARTMGFAALWDKYGAPDVCSRTPAGEYVCQ